MLHMLIRLGMQCRLEGHLQEGLHGEKKVIVTAGKKRRVSVFSRLGPRAGEPMEEAADPPTPAVQAPAASPPAGRGRHNAEPAWMTAARSESRPRHTMSSLQSHFEC